MAWKDPEKQREAIRNHYKQNKQYYIEKAMRQKQSLREWVSNIKRNTPCTDCKIQYPHYVTDFDHVTNDKVESISRLINGGNTKKLEEEIKKCELVCANCHRIRTYRRRTNKNKI